jgi:membrane-associated protein
MMEAISNFFDLLIHSDRLIQYGGLALLLTIVFLESGVFFGFIFAGDALLFTSGLLCGTKALPVSLWLLLVSVFAAAYAGNLMGYATGKIFGKRLFTREDNLFFKRKHLEKTRIYYEKYGGISLILGRFVWIVRTFVPILAGAINMDFWKFNLYNLVGALLWVGIIIPFGFFAGKLIPGAAQNLEYFILIITLIAMILLIRGILKVKKDETNHHSN